MSLPTGAPSDYRVPARYRDDFERCVRNRVRQVYGSTNPAVTAAQQRAAVTGECCFKAFLELPPDFRDKPKGDQGDAVLRLLVPLPVVVWIRKLPSELWVDADVKTSHDGLLRIHIYTDKERARGKRFEPLRIYVVAHAPMPDRAHLVGWIWGWEVRKRAEVDGEPNTAAHHWRMRPPFRPMGDLKAMILTAFHHDDTRLTGSIITC